MTPASTPPQSHRAHCGTSRPKRGLPALSLVPLLLGALCACQKAPPQALGTLEYDRIDNGNLVLGGIVIFKSDTLTPPTAEKKSAPDSKSPAPKSSATKPK